jgi:hypothetical protein
MNKQQQTQLKSLLKPVRKVAMAELLPGVKFVPQSAFGILVKDGENETLVNTCAKGYNLVPNRDIIKPLLETFEGHNLEFVTSTKLGSRFSLDVIFKDIEHELPNGDKLNAKLKMFNSYDGRWKYQFHMGFFRMICSNGMVIPLEGFKDKNTSLKMRHTPSLAEHVDKARIVDMLGLFKENTKEFTKPYLNLQKQKVSNIEERVQEVINETRFPSRKIEAVIDRVAFEMEELKTDKANDWLIYNGFNFQLNHNAEIKTDAFKKEKIDQQVLTFLLK